MHFFGVDRETANMIYFYYLRSYREVFFAALPVPASVYGLVLMLGALASGILKLEQVEEAADFLVEIMPVMFVPAGVGLLEAWGDLQPIWLPVVLITILTTVIVMVVTGRSTQFVIRKDRGKDKK